MPATADQKKQWDALIDRVFELDSQHPFIGQTVDPVSDEPKVEFGWMNPRGYKRVVKLSEALQSDAQTKGGAGSGNFGHEGRPGEVGGSGPGGSASDRASGSIPAGKIQGIVDAINEGGITWDMAHQQSLGGTHNFAVAVYPELSKELGVPLKARELYEYVKANREFLQQPGHSLGGWLDKDANKIWLDTVVTVPDEKQAVMLGKEFNQKAVFSLLDFREIPTGGTGEDTGKHGPLKDRPAKVAALLKRGPPS